MKTTILDNIYWVGCIDWNIRDIHGYEAPNGTTYNSYLIIDKKIALIDGVKATHTEQFIANIQEHIDLKKINYIICNHAEPDHSGALDIVVNLCPNAEVVCNAKCRDTLEKYYNVNNWRFLIVKEAEELSLGKRTLRFIDTPMVHWPESMATYVVNDNIIFSMDIFGQHYASLERFDHEEPLELLLKQAKIYYANIVMPYRRQVLSALDKINKLEINIIAPSHGIIWERHKEAIFECYRKWANSEVSPEIIIAYDSMWGSTKIMAEAIMDGISPYISKGISAKLFNVRTSNITILATEMLEAAAVAFGSSTLNMTIMPQMAAALTYLKGLKPANKKGFAFGSYGWGKNAIDEIAAYMKEMKIEILRENLCAHYKPSKEDLLQCKEAGVLLVKSVEGRASARP